jgi:hypothetical protein
VIQGWFLYFWNETILSRGSLSFALLQLSHDAIQHPLVLQVTILLLDVWDDPGFYLSSPTKPYSPSSLLVNQKATPRTECTMQSHPRWLMGDWMQMSAIMEWIGDVPFTSTSTLTCILP